MAKTIALTNNGDGTHTITMEFTGPSQKVLDLGEDAGRYYYPIRWQEVDGNGDPIAFDSLTNQQKLDILVKETKNHLMLSARAYHITTATDTARSTAATEADTKYNGEI